MLFLQTQVLFTTAIKNMDCSVSKETRTSTYTLIWCYIWSLLC